MHDESLSMSHKSFRQLTVQSNETVEMFGGKYTQGNKRLNAPHHTLHAIISMPGNTS